MVNRFTFAKVMMKHEVSSLSSSDDLESPSEVVAASQWTV